MSIAITRPSPDGEETVAALKRARIDAVHTPLMRIEMRPRPLPDAEADLVFTSANGVRAWDASGGGPARVWCVGPASADAARALGHHVLGVGEADGAALARLIQKHADKTRPLLHISGLHVAGDVAGALGRAGFSIIALPLYEAVAVTALPDALAEALAEGGQIGFFSARTVRLFADLVGSHDVTQTEAVCLSAVTAAAAKPLPFRNVKVSPRPTLSAFVDTLRPEST